MNTPSKKSLVEKAKLIHGITYEYWVCKCGSVEEISVCIDIEWHVCKKCKKRGCWELLDDTANAKNGGVLNYETKKSYRKQN